MPRRDAVLDEVVYRCPAERCGKWTFATRKRARRALRRWHPNEPGMRAYRCAKGGHGFHIGHLPVVRTTYGEPGNYHHHTERRAS